MIGLIGNRDHDHGDELRTRENLSSSMFVKAPDSIRLNIFCQDKVDKT